MNNSQSGAQNGTQRVYLDFEMPLLEAERKIEELEAFAQSTGMDLSAQIAEQRARADRLVQDIYENLTPWQRILCARHPARPVTSDYVAGIFTDVVELHGDRHFGDDHAILTAFAQIEGRRVLVVAHRKGKTTKDRIACNFGSAHPEGYRKALHKMQLAAKFGIPVVTLIDTPGAYPGVGAEERGQAHAIATNIFEMARLRTPVVCVVIGEGGSGGALGIGVGDRILMLENAYYSVISPEGCSSILWKTADKAAEAASILKLTAHDLLRFKCIDEIVPEPMGGAHRNHVDTMRLVKHALVQALDEIAGIPCDRLVATRYEKIRAIGVFLEGEAARARWEADRRDETPPSGIRAPVLDDDRRDETPAGGVLIPREIRARQG